MYKRRKIEDDDEEDDYVPPSRAAAPANASDKMEVDEYEDVVEDDDEAEEEEEDDYREGANDEDDDEDDFYDEDDDGARKKKQQAQTQRPKAKQTSKPEAAVSSAKSKKATSERPTLPFRNPKFSWHTKHGTGAKFIKWPRLAKMIKDEKLDELPPDVPSYVSINAPPSTKPPKKYCDITLFEAKYTDPKTGLRYHDAEAYQFIKHNLNEPDKVQRYLEIRGAGTAIK